MGAGLISQFWWYVSRSAGLVAAVLLVASLVFGVLMATRALKPLDKPSWMLAMHRWFSLLAVFATALHLIGLVADNFTHFGWVEIFVPFGSPWKRLPVTLGVIAFYLFAVVQVSSWLMKRIPKRLWRSLHMSSYALVWLVFIHAGTAGTDVRNRAYAVVALILTILAAWAAVIRMTVGRPQRGGSGKQRNDVGSDEVEMIEV
jgi:DMSO/TMAO reductase YedYZ heme-binding membrane subunit